LKTKRITNHNFNRYHPEFLWVVTIVFAIVCVGVFTYLFKVVIDVPWSDITEILLSSKIRLLIFKSLFLAFSVAVIANFLGLVFSLLIERTNLWFKKVWNVLIIISMAMPSYVLAYSWLDSNPEIASLKGAIFILTLVTTPFAYLNIRVAVKKLDVELEEVSSSLGSSSIKTFLNIVLPQLRRSLLSGMLISVLYVITDFGAVSTLRVDVFTWAIYGAFKAGFSPERAAVMSSLLFLIALTIVYVESMLRNKRKLSELNKLTIKAQNINLGSWNAIGQILLLVYSACSLIYPIAKSITWSFEYKSKLSFYTFVEPLRNTFMIGLCASIITTFIALCISVVATRSIVGKTIVKIVMAIHGIPGIVTAIAFVFVGTRLVPQIYLQWYLVIIAMSVSFAYLAIGPIRNSLDASSKSLLDTSFSLGRGKLYTFFRVTLPLSFTGLKAASILVFIAVVKELPITLLLRPNEQNTIATVLWSNIGVSKYGVVAPSMLILICLSIVPLLFLIKDKND
jgi:iron(III) transport system permease protein